jgi:acyl-coenzyme A thioesterase PaaI-like protein
VHAGVIATIADHTAGAAVVTMAGDGASVLSVEFKLNLLRGARAEGAHPRIECRGQVLKSGARITVVEAEVFGFRGTERELCAKLIATMVVVAPSAA